jgi:multiple sugar transport system permease protein
MNDGPPPPGDAEAGRAAGVDGRVTTPDPDSRHAAVGRARTRPRGPTLRQRESRTGLLLVSPTVLVVLVVVILPVLWTILLAFQRLRVARIRRLGVFDPELFTVRNLDSALTSTGFLEGLRNTLLYSVLGTGLSILLGLIAALLVRRSFPGRTFVRASMLLPYIAPVVAVTFVFQVMLDPQLGVVNAIGQDLLGWERGVPFLSQRYGTVDLLGLRFQLPLALIVVILYQGWRYFPFAFLFILARLQALPKDIDEAARVDGATPLQRFWYITLPQLNGVIALLAVLRFIWTFNEFDDIYLLTGGGAGTDVVSVQVYRFLSARGDVGAAAALSLVMAAMLCLLLLVYFKFFVHAEEGSSR